MNLEDFLTLGTLYCLISATRGNIVRIDSATYDTIRVSLTVVIRFTDASVNRYTPSLYVYCTVEKWTMMWNSRRKSRSRNPMKANLTPWLCGQLALILLKTHIFITKVASPHGQSNISSILVTISSTESCIFSKHMARKHNLIMATRLASMFTDVH